MGEGTILRNPQDSLLNKACTQENLVNQTLTYWIGYQSLEERKYPTPAHLAFLSQLRGVGWGVLRNKMEFMVQRHRLTKR